MVEKIHANRKLKAFRAGNGITQKEMADIMDINPSSYNQKENGKRNFTAIEIQRAKNKLNVDVSIFFN